MKKIHCHRRSDVFVDLRGGRSELGYSGGAVTISRVADQGKWIENGIASNFNTLIGLTYSLPHRMI
jgi:hypothetical protein